MPRAYTPGLRVTENTTLRKLRRLPLPGKVQVKVGDRVQATDVVAATELPGNVTAVNVAREMNCQPNEVPRHMVKRVGERVLIGEILAESKSFFGVFHQFARSSLEGTVEAISEVTGQVLLRGQPKPVNLEAYVDGTVVEVQGEEGVVIECPCALVQGIFGLGGEAYGELKMLCHAPDEPLTAASLDESCAGKVVVGGCTASLEALRRALAVEAAAVVVGGVTDSDVDELLGYHLGVAVTGHENLGLALVITEGFGSLPMAERSFHLLAAREGQRASVNGATQIRAGVIRPEVIVPHPRERQQASETTPGDSQLEVGSAIRLIREPYFGMLATVTSLPEELRGIETESKVRVLVATLPDGQEVTVPRANVELIEQ